MADYVYTGANVLASAAARKDTKTAGVAITRGQTLYYDSNTDTVKLFDANAAAPQNQFYGTALNAADPGQPVVVCFTDTAYKPGFTGTIGDTVIGSATPGAMCPDADCASGWFKTIIGVFIAADTIKFTPLTCGVAKP